MNYQPVIDYLVETIGASCAEIGKNAEKVNKAIEAQLCDLFECYISGRDGDAINDFFKISDGDVPYLFNGLYYERIDDMKLRYVIKKAMDEIGVGLVYRKNCHEKIARECFESLCCTESCRFQPDRRYIIFKNGVFDTESCTFHRHNRMYKTDVVLDFDYDHKAHSDTWTKLITETIPDTGMRNAFQQFCGAFLADRGKFKIEFICLLVGTGRNGKSVVCDAVRGVFGDALVSSYSPEQLFRSSQSMYNLADIHGKLANISDDVSNKDFSGGDFKQFISGAKFQARHPYGRPFTVTKVPLMLCCVNEVPPTTDDSNGHFRRLLPIVCPNQVAESDVDVELPNKLSTDKAKAAIFNWILDGYRMLVRNSGKIDICDSIKVVREEIKEESNSCRRWIKSMELRPVKPLSSTDPCWKPMKQWMEMYRMYCQEYFETPRSVKSVAKIFKELGFVSEKRSDTTWYAIGTCPVEQERGEKVSSYVLSGGESIKKDFGDEPF